MGSTRKATRKELKQLALVRELARTSLDGKRFQHSLDTAEMAASICRRFNLDEHKGYLAGLAHDLCKRMPMDRQLTLARAYDGPLPDLVFETPKFLHGPAAAVYLKMEGITTDETVMEAIAYHTVGKAGMGSLALAVYIADKIEPGRRDWAHSIRDKLEKGKFDGAEGLRKLAVATIEDMHDYIVASGRAVAATTLVLYNSLTGKSVAEWPVH
jgi:nicotinate-nucleotide adenylyltransferase